MISITESAKVKLLSLLDKDTSVVRLSVQAGGCSGFSYKLDIIDRNRTDGMIEHVFGDLKIVLDKKTNLFVSGLEIDFSDGLNGKGFEYKNPNSKRSCGCGSSFSV